MKSRLLIRALCVGAALLVPAGGLTILGVGTGTAGAATTILKFGTASTLTFGGLGTANLNGITAPVASNLGSLAGKQVPVSSTLALLVNVATFMITHSGATISAVKLKATGSVTLKGTGFTHCKITKLPAITFTLSSGKWTTSGNSLSSVTIGTTGGTCTGKTALTADFTGTNKLSGSLTLSLT
jgi:hypothetical protein